ncbi:cell division protein FtsQ/DivIB [Varibaculum vaginae]|uniref:cell division protein FtsQ/DivIB n=1 Tax=Varibaculum vaginae TaxID=2364797 RepID=UPI000F092640|nr:FtsQ-type POTRA domain-containing protein [Varibaculum vaginae]
MTTRKSSFSRRPKSTDVSKKSVVDKNRRYDGSRTRNAVSKLRVRQVTLASKDRVVISSGLAQRRQEIAQVKRRRQLRRSTIGALIVIVVAALGYLFWFSPVFAFDPAQVRVMGTSAQAPAKQVQDKVAGYAGTPLLRLPTGQVATSLQKENPWIKEIQVKREFPQGLAVYLTLRKPVGKTTEGAVVDQEGKTVPANGFEAANLAEVGTSCPLAHARDCLKSVAQVLLSLPPDLKEKVASAQAARLDNVELKLKSGAKVVWGASSDNRKKAQVLTVLLQRGGSVYNVTDYAHPTITG